MIVVSDASCINHLTRSDLVHVLPNLFGNVYISSAVFSELQAPRTPASVRQFVNGSPQWLHIRPPRVRQDLELEFIGAGESEAILLAEELAADVLLMAEKLGRRMAVKRGSP